MDVWMDDSSLDIYTFCDLVCKVVLQISSVALMPVYIPLTFLSHDLLAQHCGEWAGFFFRELNCHHVFLIVYTVALIVADFWKFPSPLPVFLVGSM